MGAIETKDFSWALRCLKAGHRVARRGWNGQGMFLFLVKGSTFTVNRPPLLGIYPEGTEINYHSHIDMKTAQGYVVPWVASQADMLAEDWFFIVDHVEVQPVEGPLDLAEFPIVDEPEPVEIVRADIDVDGPPEFR
jgi:hypothetical protein